MELDIEVKWTQEDIEEMLRKRLAKEGLLLIPQRKQTQKKKKGKGATEEEGPEEKYFAWPRGGKVKVKARAIISPRAQKVAATPSTEPQPVDDPGMDPTMLPAGTDVDALELAAKKRPRMPGESSERPED